MSSLRQLTEAECANANPLMQLGGQFSRDAARKDEGFVQAQFERMRIRQDEQMVHEFLGHVAGPPQSFQMDTLLQEMQEIEHAGAMSQLQSAPRVIDEVTANQWSKELLMQPSTTAQLPPPVHMVQMQPRQLIMNEVREFFDDGETASGPLMPLMPRIPFMPPPQTFLPQAPIAAGPMSHTTTDQFFEEGAVGGVMDTEEASKNLQAEDWVHDYQVDREQAQESAANYNEQFWQRLQDEFEKMSDDQEQSWLRDPEDVYDPYVEYFYAEQNPMKDVGNALEKGKEFLAQGEIPKAVLCFEVASKKDPENAEVWELLGMAQAENENDPNSIVALKRALNLKPDNPNILMTLAICYTNESLPAQALKHLNNWLLANPKYKDFAERNADMLTASRGRKVLSNLMRNDKLNNTQDLFLKVVQENPQQIDPEIQQALGVLYNLSGDYDKAVDCFRTAVQVDPRNAKLWNRLGASLANGSRSVEAVEAYQQALQLEPGFIRVRYNVGVCCMNLKAYKQAVEHLLTALNMQSDASARNLDKSWGDMEQLLMKRRQMSDSIWTTLKMVVSLMGRRDLSEFVNERNLPALNQAFKEDV